MKDTMGSTRIKVIKDNRGTIHIIATKATSATDTNDITGSRPYSMEITIIKASN
jgi:hypothetical protein